MMYHTRAMWTVPAPSQSAAAGLHLVGPYPKGPTMINQLRLYEIYDDTRTEFLDRFRDHAARIMRTHGFDIVSMWTCQFQGKPAFAYLLRWPDAEAMQDGWARFMADAEWKAIKAARPADAPPIVGKINDLTLEAVPFSAPLS